MVRNTMAPELVIQRVIVFVHKCTFSFDAYTAHTVYLFIHSKSSFDAYKLWE